MTFGIVDDFLQHEIDAGSFPGAVYAIGSFDRIEHENALGHAVVVPARIPATLDTIYDCASLTKPLITTQLVLKLGLLEESFHGFPVRQLLTHTSGLRAWMPLYTYDDPLRAILEHGRECEPGTRVIYSDLNFILLWLMIGRERYLDVGQALSLSGQAKSLSHTSPDAMFNPPASLRPRIAATEWGQLYESKMAGIAPIRDSLIWGETHDGNSYALGNGTAGNAGLFATARGVFRLASEFVRGEWNELASRNWTEGLNEGRGLGWVVGPEGYGHTGFTGTSLLVDPACQRIMVLLTNRVHPCASPKAMQRIRRQFYVLGRTS